MPTLQTQNTALIGASYMLLSCLLFSVMGGLIRYTSTDLHPFIIVFFRTLIGLIILLPSLRHMGFAALARVQNKKIIVLRGLSSTVAVFSTFYAFSTIPLATATSFSFAVPLLATLGAALFLGEIIRLPRIISLCVGFTGVLILLNPNQMDMNWGTIAAMISVVAVASTTLFVRTLSKTEPVNVIVILGFLLTLPITFVVVIFYWQWPTPIQWVLLVSVGLIAAGTQIAMTKAFSMAETSALMPLDFSRLVFASAIGYFLFDEKLTWNILLGASIILVSTVYIARREAKQNRELAERISQPPSLN